MRNKYAAAAFGRPVAQADCFEAFRRLVYQSGDVAAFAAQMGLKPGTLYNKADADADTHHQPTLRDVVLATTLTGDTQVVEALARQFGLATFAVAQHANTSDAALLELLCQVGDEKGQFCRALNHALIDRKFTRAELGKVRAEAFDLVGAVMTLVARAEGMVDD